MYEFSPGYFRCGAVRSKVVGSAIAEGPKPAPFGRPLWFAPGPPVVAAVRDFWTCGWRWHRPTAEFPERGHCHCGNVAHGRCASCAIAVCDEHDGFVLNEPVLCENCDTASVDERLLPGHLRASWRFELDLQAVCAAATDLLPTKGVSPVVVRVERRPGKRRWSNARTTAFWCYAPRVVNLGIHDALADLTELAGTIGLTQGGHLIGIEHHVPPSVGSVAQRLIISEVVHEEAWKGPEPMTVAVDRSNIGLVLSALATSVGVGRFEAPRDS